jgi:Flp pilus assembly protein TadG
MRQVNPSKRRRQGGNALIEFSLAFGFLFPTIMGTFQFGYAFFIYNELQNAVRQGARYAAFKTYASASSTPVQTFTDEVLNSTVYGDPAGGTVPVAPNLTTGNVTLTVTFVNGVPGIMTVSIKNYTLDAFLKTFTINKPSASFNYVGVYAPPA